MAIVAATCGETPQTYRMDNKANILTVRQAGHFRKDMHTIIGIEMSTGLQPRFNSS